MNTRKKLETMRQVDAANEQHVKDWKDQRDGVMRLEATQTRIAVWAKCLELRDTCEGCPYKFAPACDELFPSETPWGAAIIPADFNLEDDELIIKKEES